jgi:predicted XRE-type DNA-binding protein
MTKPSDKARKRPQDIQIEGSSGNVFLDLAFENADEELLKAQLAHVIGTLLQQRGATQTRAAALLGTTQPKVSNLLRGRTEAFSVQKLFEFLNQLDQDVVVSLRPKPKRARRGRTTFLPLPAIDREPIVARAAHAKLSTTSKKPVGAPRGRFTAP